MGTINIGMGSAPGLIIPGTDNAQAWQLSNIFDGIRRIPAFFRRINPALPGSPGSMLKRFVIASAPDLHGKYDELVRFKTFIDLIKDDSSLSPTDVVWGLMAAGDVGLDMPTKAEFMTLLAEFATIGASYGVDLLALIDDHDSNSGNSNTTAIVLSKLEQRQALIDPIINSVSGIVSDVLNADACYYYKDYDGGTSFKVRVIALDQSDMSQDITGDSYTYPIHGATNLSQEQLTWLAEVALAVPSVDWHVMIFSGRSIGQAATYNTSHTAVQQLIDAFTQQGTVIMNDATADFAFTLNEDFSVINGFYGTVVGWFYGSGHIPLVQKYTINGREYNNIELPAADQQTIGWNRQANTGITDMMTFIVADTEDRRIFLLRYGNPCNVNGIGLPFGDFGIDSMINYFCAEYQDIYNSFVTKPSDSIAIAQNKIVWSLVNAGVWTKLDIFYLFAQTTNDDDEALVNWINPGTFDAILVNAPAFVALEGFSGNGTNARIDSYNPTASAVNYALNSASYGIYVRTNVAENKDDCGALTGANRAYLETRSAGDGAVFSINDTTASGAASTDSRGMWIASRMPGPLKNLYRNGALHTAAGAVAATGIPDDEFEFLSCSFLHGYCTKQESLGFLGGGLSVDEVIAITNAVETYMDSNLKGIIT